MFDNNLYSPTQQCFGTTAINKIEITSVLSIK